MGETTDVSLLSIHFFIFVLEPSPCLIRKRQDENLWKSTEVYEFIQNGAIYGQGHVTIYTTSLRKLKFYVSVLLHKKSLKLCSH